MTELELPLKAEIDKLEREFNVKYEKSLNQATIMKFFK